MPAADYRRIGMAIRYLEEHYTAQPSLAEVAAHVGLSEYHFQRTFRRWAGISPKRLLQYLTVEHAKCLLRESESVLATTYRVGLSGPGRLHDHFVSVEGMSPGEFKRLGEGLQIRYGVHSSPFGECFLAATERGICALSFLEAPPRWSAEAAIAELGREWPSATIVRGEAESAELVARIFGGFNIDGVAEREDPAPLPVLLKGTNFQLKVWEALLRIPPGSVTSYGALADTIQHPGAGRAVGSALAANRVAFLIPCHRVLRKLGGVGGYRWGTERKRAMLAWESARAEIRQGGNPPAQVEPTPQRSEVIRM